MNWPGKNRRAGVGRREDKPWIDATSFEEPESPPGGWPFRSSLARPEPREVALGAFGVLLLRMTQKRFSATQYALFSSLFGLPRLIAGPVTGMTVHSLGWTTFYWLTMIAGVPGLLLLARFVPPGTREPTFRVEPPRSPERLSRAARAASRCPGYERR